ncbi:hypothetical protein NDU88_007348 [Pleurodeles waltl]|uniref:Uncharacterized protein n=1 Tax=Pleurodeles waltl TaxID=8319 RepID=A0AAV7N202_PLEWA|nr:hypothetical protein NDU88_007348 [Pleurodeles waltl]
MVEWVVRWRCRCGPGTHNREVTLGNEDRKERCSRLAPCQNRVTRRRLKERDCPLREREEELRGGDRRRRRGNREKNSGGRGTKTIRKTPGPVSDNLESSGSPESCGFDNGPGEHTNEPATLQEKRGQASSRTGYGCSVTVWQVAYRLPPLRKPRPALVSVRTPWCGIGGLRVAQLQQLVQKVEGCGGLLFPDLITIYRLYANCVRGALGPGGVRGRPVDSGAASVSSAEPRRAPNAAGPSASSAPLDRAAARRMAFMEKPPAGKVLLDDTVPLTAVIEASQSLHSHTVRDRRVRARGLPGGARVSPGAGRGGEGAGTVAAGGPKPMRRGRGCPGSGGRQRIRSWELSGLLRISLSPSFVFSHLCPAFITLS